MGIILQQVSLRPGLNLSDVEDAAQARLNLGFGPGGGYPEVANWSALPAAASSTGDIYAVLAPQGSMLLLTLKRAGLWYSNGATWVRLGDVITLFNDTNTTFYNGTDTTKKLGIDLSGIPTATTRTLTITASATIDQDISKTADVEHNSVTLTNTGTVLNSGANNINVFPTALTINAGQAGQLWKMLGNLEVVGNTTLATLDAVTMDDTLTITAASATLLDLNQSSTAANSSGFDVLHSGAITGTGYGGTISKTGASTTNVALKLSASGATNNYGLIIDAGLTVGIGTITPMAAPLANWHEDGIHIVAPASRRAGIALVSDVYSSVTLEDSAATSGSRVGIIIVDGGKLTLRGAGNDYTGTNGDIIMDLSNGWFGIGKAPAFQLELSTDSAGKPSTNTWTIVSDPSVKNILSRFTDGLNVIEKIDPITFKYNGLAGFKDTDSIQIGINAKKLLPVAPYCISKNKHKLRPDDTELTELLNYEGHAMTFVLINSVKELSAQNEAQQKEINQLREQLQGCN